MYLLAYFCVAIFRQNKPGDVCNQFLFDFFQFEQSHLKFFSDVKMVTFLKSTHLPVIPPPGEVVRCTGTASCTGTYRKGHNCLGLNSENSMSTCLGSAELQCLLL